MATALSIIGAAWGVAAACIFHHRRNPWAVLGSIFVALYCASLAFLID